MTQRLQSSVGNAMQSGRSVTLHTGLDQYYRMSMAIPVNVVVHPVCCQLLSTLLHEYDMIVPLVREALMPLLDPGIPHQVHALGPVMARGGGGAVRQNKGGRGLGGGGTRTPPAATSTAPAHQTTGLRERGNDTSGSTGRSGRQNAATRRNMRREERMTVRKGLASRRNVTHGGGGGGSPPRPSSLA